MSIRNLIIAVSLIPSLFSFSSLAGGSEAETKAPSNYHEELNKAEEAFKSRDLEQLKILTDQLLQMRPHEEPNYLLYFFLAYLEYHRGETEKSAANLSNFKCMLRVDSGVRACPGHSQLEKTRPTINVDLTLCQKVMCGEIYYGYYEKPSHGTLNDVARYWSYADELTSDLAAQ